MIHRFEFKAMGCRMLAAVDSSSARAPGLLQQVPGWFESWEQSLSRFRADSELNFLNGSKGVPVRVSETFLDVLQTALDTEQASGGLVTPAVLDALVLAGYDRSFELLPTDQARLEPLDRFATATSLSALTWDASTRTICLPLGVHLDFGGVAKGWAAHQAVERIEPYGPALVDAGGDIAISGLQADGQPWPVGITDPFNPGSDLELLALGGGGGVATSGTDYHRWKQAGNWSHHIIDPRTGLPAETDVVAATVVAPTVVEAEMAAKVAFISGSQFGLAWLEGNPGLAGLLVLENGQRLYSQRMENFFWR